MRSHSSTEVAEALGISAASVQRYARGGLIPFDQTPGGHRRFDLEEVRAALTGPATNRPRRRHARAVVLTALQVEYSAVCEELENQTDRTLPNGTIFTEGDLEGDVVDWHVAVAEVGEGNLGATAEASAAIDYYTPDLLLFVGVAGGLKPDIPQGSVVVATKIYQYQSGKDADEVLTRPNTFPTDHALVQLARKVRRGDWDWEGEKPIVELKPIAAGELVLANSRSLTAELIRRHFNDAAAVDMESAGMYQAAHRSRGVPALAVRGISDMLDDKTADNDQDWQPRAARNAARFAVALLEAADENQLSAVSAEDGDDSELEALLRCLPMNVSDRLRDVDDLARSIDRVRVLASGSANPQAALANVRAEIASSGKVAPPWVLALAEFAFAHTQLQDARELFRDHSELVDDPARSLAMAGLAAFAQDDSEGAIELLGTASDLAKRSSDRAFATMLRLIVLGDYADAVEAAKGLDPSDSLGQIFRSRVMTAVGQVREARDLVTTLVRDHPRAAAGMMLEAAERIIQATVTLEPEQGEIAHLRRAYELAVSARDQRRAWGGDSAAASVVAARAAGLADDHRSVLSLVLQPPSGQALPTESSSSELCQLGCYAAMQLSQYSLARQLARNVDDPIEAELIGIAVREAEGAEAAELVPALKRLVSAEGLQPDQLSRALLHLVRHGESDEAALSRLAAEEPQLAELVRARAELAAGETSAARRRLTGINSPMALNMLAEASLREGRHDDVLIRLRERFHATGNASYIADAADHMLAARRPEDAAHLAVEGLAVSDLNPPLRLRLEEIAVQAFANLHDWPNVERYARSASTSADAQVGVRWALVFALHNQRRLADALDTLREYSLVPRTEDEAACALVLWRQHSDAAEAIDASVAIARSFADSEEVVGTALMSSLELSARMPDEDKPNPSVKAALAELSDSFFANWPDSEIVTRFSGDTPEEMLTQVAEAVRRGAPSEDLIELSKSATLGHAPLGVLSSAAGKSLLEAIASSAAGPVLISTIDPSARSEERAAASRALDGEVVCDVHTATVLAALPEHAEALSKHFLRLRTPMNVVDDVLEGNDRLQRLSTATLTWDAVEERMRLIEIPASMAEAAAERAGHAAGIVRSMMVPEVVRTDDAFSAPRFGVVLAPIELARSRGIALWSDDPGLRATARGEGIPSFGTLDVLDALVDGGHLSRVRASQIRASLLREGFDLEVSTEMALDYLIAGEFDFPAASILARRTVWIDPERGLSLLKATLSAAPLSDSERWRDVVANAAYGAASVAVPPKQPEIMVAVGMSALFQAGDQVAAFPHILAALRLAARGLSLPDPLTDLVRQLQAAYESNVDSPFVVTRLVLHAVSAAAETDRRAVSEILLIE